MAARRPLGWVRVLVAAALGASVALSGCSSSSDAASTTSSTTTTIASRTTAAASPAASPSDGCGQPAPVPEVSDQRPGDVARTFASGGVDRVYRLAVPQGYRDDEPVALIVNLHGSASDALQASTYGAVPQAASERGMAVVTPEAIDGRWELGGTGRDADFLAALVDDVEDQLCVDRDRVHLMGMSLGAWKAAATACAERGRYASVALVTVEVFPGTCDPLAVIAFHGTADPVVAYGPGGGTVDDVDTPNAGLPGTRTNIAAWARNGGCDPTPNRSALGDDVTRERYTGCDPGVGVELYTIDGGGHTWPGADIDITAPELTTHTIDATTLALDWFEAHPRRG